MKSGITNNWKIDELIKEYSIEIIPIASQEFDQNKIISLGFPIKKNDLLSIHKTLIEWNVTNNYHCFFLDDYTEEELIVFFKKSILAEYTKLVISFGWNESVAIIPAYLFLNDPLEFFATQFYSGFIYSYDYKLIIEISEDYYIYSNFKIISD